MEEPQTTRRDHLLPLLNPPQKSVRFAGIEERVDVGALEIRRGLDLLHEPLGPKYGGELGLQHLECDLAVVLQVLGELDGRQAALAEMALDLVAVGEGRRGAFGYFWEYIHRVWARLVGVVLAVPLIFFGLKKWLSRPLAARLVLLLALTGVQGVLGWFMVASGLADRTDVSQYRLAAHLGLALVIYVVTVWTAADLLAKEAETSQGATASTSPLRSLAAVLIGLVFTTAIAGAFVAGLDGGRAYNTFPLMGGQFVPGGYFTLTPWWRNLFENVAAVQFNHRWIGMLTFVGVVVIWFRGRKARMPEAGRFWLDALLIAAVLQVALGIATLLLVVPVGLAAFHQAGAVILLTAGLLFYHALARFVIRDL